MNNTILLPEQLLKARQWVTWKLEARPQGQKPAKVPYSPTRNNKRALPNNANTWGSFETALASLHSNRFDGLGFVLSDSDPFAVIDLDACIDPKTGEVALWAKDIIQS